jgi:TolB-like protein/DNA-binding winged helix-turn-helix (wHTH) protein/tetratricopeptide (TPR) repeat protein
MGVPRINLAETPDFDLGGLRVSPARRQVSMSGECRELEPKVAQVLIALATASPAVVSRDNLVEQCWDGRIVGDDALNRCILALRHLAKAYSPEPFAIETVPRVGYSLVAGAGQGTASNQRRANRPRGLGLVLVLLLLLAGAGVFSWVRYGRAETAPASIAVVSFRNLSKGDPYFAEGIGEEIRGQLSREPQFRVAGGNSSDRFEQGADIRDVARRLNVVYVLEGSVQTQGNRVRVNSDLVRASDGMRLWSDSYDGDLDDIFAIQQSISAAIAQALRRKLVRAPELTGPLVTNPQAYNSYLTARGLLKGGGPDVGRTAANLLRDALNSDPGYAPAWVSLAHAKQLAAVSEGPEAFIAARREAQRYAAHALQLAPDLAVAHRELGFSLPYGSPESKAHLRRAAELDPSDAENLLGLGLTQGANGEFDSELETYRRANAIDPLWYRTTGQLAIALSEMGRRAEAEAVGRRGFSQNPSNLQIILGRIAWNLGDSSEAGRRWSIVARSNSPRWSRTAKGRLEEVKYQLGLGGAAEDSQPRDPQRRRTFRSWLEAPPAPAVWKARNRDAMTADQYRDDNHVAAKLMLNAGRASELAATYDSAVGLMSLRPGKALRVDQLSEAPVVSIALRQVGRSAEANSLLVQADRIVRKIYRATTVPFWFEADAAAIFAAEGRTGEALSALERAMSRGWSDGDVADLRDLADEPAFRALRGNVRFERIRSALKQHNARERAEFVRLQI